jgi:hypothetical protein
MLHANDDGAFLVFPIDEIMASADRVAASASEIDDHVSDGQVGLLARALHHTALEPV